MTALRIILDSQISEFSRFDFNEDIPVGQLVEQMNKCPYMMTLHGIDRSGLQIILNNSCRDFYGFDKNDLSSMNLSFYYKTQHPLRLKDLVRSHFFFVKNELGYLEINYLLRNAQGKYENVLGVTRTIAWSENGIATYALSVLCRESDYRMTVIKDIFQLENLSKREQEVLPLLMVGLTNGQISLDLHVSEKTIEKHVSSILKQAGKTSRADFFAAMHQVL